MATLGELEARVARIEEREHVASGVPDAQSFGIGRVYEATQDIRAELGELRDEVRGDLADLRQDVAEVKTTLGEILRRLPERE